MTDEQLRGLADRCARTPIDHRDEDEQVYALANVLMRAPARRIRWFNWFALIVLILGAICVLHEGGAF